MSSDKALRTAIAWAYLLQDGLNPITNRPFSDLSELTHPRLQKYFAYLVELLTQQIEPDAGSVSVQPPAGEPPAAEFAADSNGLPFSRERLEQVRLSEQPIGINELADRINALAETEGERLVTGPRLLSWLTANGYLVPEETDGKTRRVPTPLGEQLGIQSVEAVSRYTGEPYRQNRYTLQAQQFLLSHLPEIAVRENKPSGRSSHGSTGKRLPFHLTDEQRAQVPISEEPVGITELAKRISSVIDADRMERVNASRLNDWLAEHGYLREFILGGKRKRLPTTEGERMGIIVVEGTTKSGVSYKQTLYDADAQRWILAQINRIAASQAE